MVYCAAFGETLESPVLVGCARGQAQDLQTHPQLPMVLARL